jgi:hypothetical protein
VLEALRSRDPLVAEAAMRKHIEEPGDWIRDAVRKEKLEGETPADNAELAAGQPGKATAS